MVRPSIQVLFVSRRGSVRSIVAAALLSHFGKGRFSAHACGLPRETAPAPAAAALAALRSVGIPHGQTAVQDWTHYSRGSARPMDFIIVLDHEVALRTPSWPGNPAVALWEYPDIVEQAPSPTELAPAMMRLLFSLRRRIELFAALPIEAASRSDVAHDLRDMAHLEPEPATAVHAPGS